MNSYRESAEDLPWWHLRERETRPSAASLRSAKTYFPLFFFFSSSPANDKGAIKLNERNAATAKNPLKRFMIPSMVRSKSDEWPSAMARCGRHFYRSHGGAGKGQKSAGIVNICPMRHLSERRRHEYRSPQAHRALYPQHGSRRVGERRVPSCT